MARWGLSFGGDANAYTDTRFTVYTLRAPVKDAVHQAVESNVVNVVDLLHQLAFEALLPEDKCVLEKAAVLSELQFGNTQSYRQLVAMCGQVCVCVFVRGCS